MTEHTASLIVPVGTQVVLHGTPQTGHTAGAVAEIISSPTDAQHAYRVRFPDGSETSIRDTRFSLLTAVKTGPIGACLGADQSQDLTSHVIYRCVVGSEAYGLSRESSDIDRRGIFLPPAELEWSLFGVPEQIEFAEREECYWELKKFLILALKATPNILVCLYTPLVETTSVIAEDLLGRQDLVLSKLVYQTYNGYVLSQFKKLEQDLRATGSIRWKHAMHLIRLLLRGISVLNEGHVSVRVDDHRHTLLAIRDGKLPWSEINDWRLALHKTFSEAYQTTALPERPNYIEANELLIRARRHMVEAKR